MSGGFSAISYFSDLLVLSVIVLPLFHFIRHALVRRVLLASIGAFLLWLLAPRLALFYGLFWLAVWVLHRMIIALSGRSQRDRTLLFGIVILLAPMVLWKLLPAQFTIQFNLVLHGLLDGFPRMSEIDVVRQILIPIGLSFATFRAIDLLVQTHLGLIKTLTLDRALFFGLFPPVQIIGPIIEYSEIASRSEQVQSLTADDLFQGARRIVTGLIKVYVLAYPLQHSGGVFMFFDFNSAATLWLGLFVFAIYFYLNFAGYSDIAIGAARLFGFTLKENFDRPYLRPNPQAFWAHWHMSLTRFSQRNVFVPLGGFRAGTQYVALVATIMTIALWHDLSLSLVLFGIYHAFGLVAHRWWDHRRRSRGLAMATGWAPRTASTLACFVFVMLSFPMLMLPATQLVAFYAAMAGL